MQAEKLMIRLLQMVAIEKNLKNGSVIKYIKYELDRLNILYNDAYIADALTEDIGFDHIEQGGL